MTATHVWRICLGMAQKINIARLRSSLNETQAEFAERCGVNQSTVCRWEAGDEPSGLALALLRLLERERLTRIRKTELRAAG